MTTASGILFDRHETSAASVNMACLSIATTWVTVGEDVPVSAACEKFNISRKTGYKWLKRFAQQPGVPLVDRSRRPETSPKKTMPDVEPAVLDVRERFH